MKHLFIESLKAYELTSSEKSKIMAKNGKLKYDTEGEEDCFILDPTTKLLVKKNDPACI
ncbi:conserved protein of unknown function [Tenacibaculum sp. 190130A14a]|uniref:Uncharacterized protein n=1 Tax=Tenacibaculum polynesiense TaxID=3137857 RepID=A0ABP1F480_9FLAO